MSRAIGSIPRTELVRNASSAVSIRSNGSGPSSTSRPSRARPVQDEATHHTRQQRAVQSGRAQAPALDEKDVGTGRLEDEPLGRKAQHVVRPGLERLRMGDPLAPVVERLVPGQGVIRGHFDELRDDRARLTDRGRQRPDRHPEDRARGRRGRQRRRTR